MTKISQIGEFQLIERIKRTVGGGVIGSDTAPIKIGGLTYLATCDALLEGRHFLRSYQPEKIGFKAISVNVSDIVASGGKPKFVLISLFLPDLETTYVDSLYQGMLSACKKYRCQIIGGNIAKSEKIGVDVFMIGVAKKFVGRAKLKIGDSIFITGALGDSRAGLTLLRQKKSDLENFEKVLIERHLNPKINLNLADYINTHANSSLDISDGLSGDLYHLKGDKKIKISVNSNAIPISKELALFCKKYRHDAIKYAMTGGEDYKILFTKKGSRSPYTKIGQIEKGDGIYVDGNLLKNNSFDHFK
jgi:thiamine-monophosphate kinase